MLTLLPLTRQMPLPEPLTMFFSLMPRYFFFFHAYARAARCHEALLTLSVASAICQRLRMLSGRQRASAAEITHARAALCAAARVTLPRASAVKARGARVAAHAGLLLFDTFCC